MRQREEPFRPECVPPNSLIKEAHPDDIGKTCTSFLHRSGAYLTLDSFNKCVQQTDGLDPRCRDCMRYAINVNHAKKKERENDAAGEHIAKVTERVLKSPSITPPKEEPQEEVIDRRTKRTNWPKDKDLRREDIRGCLGISLVENEGDIAEVGLCLNVPIHEILDILDGDDNLMECREVGRRVKAIKLESKLYQLAHSGNQQSVKMGLNNLNPDEWGDKQQVDVRRVGFAPPEKNSAEEEVSILQIVKGEKNA